MVATYICMDTVDPTHTLFSLQLQRVLVCVLFLFSRVLSSIWQIHRLEFVAFVLFSVLARTLLVLHAMRKMMVGL